MFPLRDIAGPKFLKLDLNSNFKPNLIQKWRSLHFWIKFQSQFWIIFKKTDDDHHHIRFNVEFFTHVWVRRVSLWISSQALQLNPYFTPLFLSRPQTRLPPTSSFPYLLGQQLTYILCRWQNHCNLLFCRYYLMVFNCSIYISSTAEILSTGLMKQWPSG